MVIVACIFFLVCRRFCFKIESAQDSEAQEPPPSALRGAATVRPLLFARTLPIRLLLWLDEESARCR